MQTMGNILYAMNTHDVSWGSMNTPLGTLRYGGIWPESRGTGFRQIRHLEVYALVLILRGEGSFRDETGLEEPLEAGDLFCAVPRVGHQYGPAPGDTWSEAFITCNGTAFDAWREEGFLLSGKVVRERWSVKALESTFTDLLSHPVTDRQDAVDLLGTLHSLICHLFGPETPDPSGSSNRLLRSRHSIETWPVDQPLDWDSLARTAGYSYHAWRRAFRFKFGLSPGQYRRHVLVDRAAALLLRTDMTLEEIASRLHLSDASHLSRLFLSIRGESPGAFRRRRSRHVPGDTPWISRNRREK